jgi:sulfatase maturation enzyme AslB (radical SAM superfamily)
MKENNKVITYINVNQKCNLKCCFCYLWNYLNKYNPLLNDNYNDEYYNNIFMEKDIDKNIIFTLRILWWESLLSFDFYLWLFLFIIKKDLFEGINIIEINTNGYFIDKFLIFFDKNWLLNTFKEKIIFKVSIHGLKETHNRLVGKDVFLKIIWNIWMLDKRKIKFSINYVVNRINIDDIIKFNVLIRKIAKDVHIIYLFLDYSWKWFDNYKDLYIDFSDKNLFNKLRSIFIYLEEKYWENIESNVVFPFCLTNNINQKINASPIGRSYHIWAWFLTKLLLFDNKEKEEGVIDIYKSKFSSYYVYTMDKNVLKPSKYLFDKCKNCKALNSCSVYGEWEYKLLSKTHGLDIKWESYINLIK